MTGSLIEKLTARRAGILAACENCGGVGVVQGDGVEMPCPKCRLSELTTLCLGDVSSKYDASATRPISPSEIESFLLCQRRWGWERLDGIKVERGNDAAELGKATHKQLERWFVAGILPDPTDEAGRIAESGLHLWPAPAEVSEIEIHIGCETDAGRYHGYQDIGYIEPETAYVVVGDHKTTGDFKWAKTAEELRTNIQAAIYARSAMERHGVEQVKLRWVYYRTKGARKAYPVEVIVTVPEVEQVFDEIIDPVAREIHAAEASGKTGVDMEINARSCDAFGGCPHASRCNLSPSQRLVSLMSQMSLKEKIEAKKAAAAAAGNAPVIPPAPAPHINPPESQLPPAPAVVPVAAAPAPTPESNVVPASSFAAKMAAKKGTTAAAPAAPATGSAPAPAPSSAVAAAKKALADAEAAEAAAEAARVAAVAEAARVAAVAAAEAKAVSDAAAAATATTAAPKAARKASTSAAPETGSSSKRLLDVCAALEGATSIEQRRVLAAVSTLLGIGEAS